MENTVPQASRDILAEMVREGRAEKSMTQDELAMLMGNPVEWVEAIELGNLDPTAIEVVTLFGILDLDPQDFVRRNKEAN